jgi:hypothetical protein
MLITLKLRQDSTEDGCIRAYPGKAWDCGCRRHLKAGSEEVLIAKVIYHLDVQHPEAHPTLEQATELVAAQAYEEPSSEEECNALGEALEDVPRLGTPPAPERSQHDL